MSFGTHKETYPLCLNVSTKIGAPNHPNFAYERMLLQKILTSHGAWNSITIYIYIYKEHLVEIIYTLVGSEILKKINFKLAKPQN